MSAASTPAVDRPEGVASGHHWHHRAQAASRTLQLTAGLAQLKVLHSHEGTTCQMPERWDDMITPTTSRPVQCEPCRMIA